MFRNVLVLTKVLLSGTSGLFQLKFRKVNTKTATILFWVLMALCFLPLMGLLYKFFSSMYQSFALLNQVDTLTATVLNLMSTVIFMFSLFTAPAVFYFSKDIETLLPLPLRDVEIITAKFLIAVLYEYMILALFLLPFYAVMIQHVNPITFVPAALVVFLLLPVFPLCYSSVIVMFLMSFSRFSKNREAFNFIVSLFAIVFGMSFSIFSQRLAAVDTAEILQTLENNQSLLNSLATLFPDSRFAASAIANSSFPSLLACIALPCAAFCMFLLIARLLYFKGVMGASDARRTDKKLSADHVIGQSRLQSPFFAYVKKEMKLLFRSPILFLNCVLTSLLVPALILIPLTVSVDESFKEVLSIDLSQGPAAAITLIICAAAGVFMGMLNLVSTTAISREGSGYVFMKYIPLSYKTQINAKVMPGLLLGWFGSLMTMCAAGFFLQIPLMIFLAGLILAILGSVFINYFGILLDLTYPKLHWDNEQQAVKQNMNTLIMMLISFAIIAVLAIPSVLLLKTPLVAFAALFTSLTLIDILSYQLVMKLGVRLLAKL